MKPRTAMRFAQYGFLAISIGALAYCAEAWWRARLYQQRETRDFNRELAGKNGARPPRRIRQAATLPREGGLVGRLEIPRVGISVMVVEGVEADDLERAAGHIPGTALPGQRGNVGIAAHRDTYFRPLAKIHSGDAMTLETLDGLYRYQVVSTQIVRPENVAVLYPTGRDALTLVTCYPFHYVGPAPMRFIVRAVRL